MFIFSTLLSAIFYAADTYCLIDNAMLRCHFVLIVCAAAIATLAASDTLFIIIDAARAASAMLIISARHRAECLAATSGGRDTINVIKD